MAYYINKYDSNNKKEYAYYNTNATEFQQNNQLYIFEFYQTTHHKS